MESDVGKLFLKAYKRFPKTEEVPQLHKMIEQPDGCTKLVNILNRTIEKSITPKVINYLITSFATEPVSNVINFKTGNTSQSHLNYDNGYTTGEWASIIKS